MVSQPYVDGITDTVSHGITSILTAGQIQIAAGQDTLSVAVVSPDRWFPWATPLDSPQPRRPCIRRRGRGPGRLHRPGHHQAAGQLSARAAPYAVSMTAPP